MTSEMFRRGFNDAAISFSYIPDFASAEEKAQYGLGLSRGYAARESVEIKIKRVKESISDTEATLASGDLSEVMAKVNTEYLKDLKRSMAEIESSLYRYA